MPVIEGERSPAIIVEIRPESQLGGEGDRPIGILKHDDGQTGWYPLAEADQWTVGQRVNVTTITELVGDRGGARVTFKIAPLTTDY